MSPLTHPTRLDEGDAAVEGAAGFTLLLSGYEADSPQQWSDDECESASDLIRRENNDIYDHLQMIWHERDIFQSANDQYVKELSQLKHQMKLLQMQQRSSGSQSSHPSPFPRQHNYDCCSCIFII